MLLVIEDGHWADAPTLLLLRHLARCAGSARLLLLATFRDTEADVPAALSETLADLRRSDDVVRLRLAGLSRRGGGGVRQPRREAAMPAPVQPSSRRRSATSPRATPFLVCELWRALVETGGVEVVDRRDPADPAPGRARHARERPRGRQSAALARLAPGTTRSARARRHRRVGVRARRSCAGPLALEDVELLAALDEAVRSGMIEEVPSRGLAYRFTHELVRRALYDRLTAVAASGASPSRRRGARRTAEDRSGRALADLAHHFAAAAPFGGGPARRSSTTCAPRAPPTAALAFDEAAARLRTALELGIEDPA